MRIRSFSILLKRIFWQQGFTQERCVDPCLPSSSICGFWEINWKRMKGKLIHVIFFFNGILVIMVLLGIFMLLVLTCIPAFKEIRISQFLLTTNWNPSSYVVPVYGILAMVVSTFMVTFGALLIAIPLGIGTAAYLSDIASHCVREIAKPIIEILAGIPSVVIGFLGIILVGPLIAKIFF